MKRRLFASILCILLLTGCWDRKELNEVGIVGAIGLDKDSKTEEIILTSQVIRPGALKKEGGGGEKSPVENITTRGNTVFEAMRNITKQFDRKAYFPHTKVIVIGEHLARDGILPILDVFIRSQEIRRLVWFTVAKDTTAEEILGVKHGIENVQAAYLDSIIKRRSANSEVSTPNLLEVLKRVSGNEINPIAGVMEVIEQPNRPVEEKNGLTTKGVKLSGTAVFKKDKLVGYLDDIETRGLNWVTGKVESGVINVPSPTEKDKLIAIEIKRASSSIKPEIKDGEISFTIEVKEEGDIVEQQGITDVSKLELFEKIEKEQEEVIENEIKMAVDKVQKEFNSDIFGFGSVFNKKYPKEWNKIKDNWESIFPKVQYVVKVDAKLRRTGLLLKSVKPGE